MAAFPANDKSFNNDLNLLMNVWVVLTNISLKMGGLILLSYAFESL